MHTDVPRPDVVSAVQEADLLLVTSHREAAPLILLECMAAGTPWISLSLGAVADCAGVVVVDSLAEMERVAAELLSRPDEARKLATAGRAAVVGNHAWPKIAPGRYCCRLQVARRVQCVAERRRVAEHNCRI